jgi:hypothetical protein
VRATCPAHLIILNLITRIIFVGRSQWLGSLRLRCSAGPSGCAV